MKVRMLKQLLFIAHLFLYMLFALNISGCLRQTIASPESDQSSILIEKGYDHFENKDYADALEAYNKALELATRASDSSRIADINYRIGRVLLSQQQYNEALSSFQRALTLIEAGDASRDKAVLRNSIGIVFQIQGKFGLARQQFAEELVIRKELADIPGEVRALVNLGATFFAQGQYAQAMGHYQNAEKLVETIKPGDVRLIGVVLTHLGSLYAELGQYEKALVYHQKALSLNEKNNDSSGMAAALHNIGYTHAEQENYSEAIVFFRKAEALHRKLDDYWGRANSLNNLGLTLSDDGQTTEALQTLFEALRILRELDARKQLAATLDSIGDVYKKLGDYPKALDFYSEGLGLWKQLGDRDGERITLANIGSVLALENKKNSAILFYKMSVNITQAIRTELKFLPKKEQQDYANRIEKNYRHLANLLIDQGRLAEAEQVLTMLKEEEFFEFMNHRGALTEKINTVAVLSKIGQEEAARYNQISMELITLARELELLRMKKSKGLSPDESERLQQLDQDITLANKVFRKYVEDLEKVITDQGTERGKEFAKKDTESLKRIKADLKTLGEGSMLIHIFFIENGLRFLLTTPDVSVHRDYTKITWEELNHLIFEYRDALKNRQSDALAKGKILYDHIIGPIEEDLAEARVLLLSLDDTLRYLPFAALYDGVSKKYLTERYNLAIYTAAADSDLTTPPQEKWRVAGMGVSKRASASFAALPAVQQELNEIVREERDEDLFGVFPGVVRLNSDFTAAQLSSDLRERYPVVHIASHFKFMPGNEDDSFLLLGENKKLTLADIQDGDFPFTDVDLLTLSACETAYSERNARGKELESFGVLAQLQGAKAVIASLWSVDDSSTAEFMASFYKLRQEGLTKSEALRQTQIAFLKDTRNNPDEREGDDANRGAINVDSPEAGSTSTADKSYTHPFYWAPFILMGNYL